MSTSQSLHTDTKDKKIRRFDERDTVFAVHDLLRYFGEEHPYAQEYFRDHADELPFYRNLSNRLHLGATGKVDTPLFDSQFWVLDKISTEDFVDGEVNPDKVDLAPKRASEKLKGIARFMGADLVGMAALKQEWVYTNVGSNRGDREGFLKRGTPIDLQKHTNAIAMGFHMDYALMQQGPHFPELLATAKGYARSAWVAVQVASIIRQWGYSARAHHFGNYQVLPVPIAVDCGLGELSRAGYLLTKQYGLGLRLSVVTTDMPLAHDEPIDIGVQSFCEQCELCAQHCPVGAIPFGSKREYNGVMKWKLDEKKCYAYWAVNQTDCGACMSVCPWTKPPTIFHKIMAEFARIKGPHQRWMAWADHLVYGNQKRPPKPDYLD